MSYHVLFVNREPWLVPCILKYILKYTHTHWLTDVYRTSERFLFECHTKDQHVLCRLDFFIYHLVLFLSIFIEMEQKLIHVMSMFLWLSRPVYRNVTCTMGTNVFKIQYGVSRLWNAWVLKWQWCQPSHYLHVLRYLLYVSFEL